MVRDWVTFHGLLVMLACTNEGRSGQDTIDDIITLHGYPTRSGEHHP